MKFDDLDEPRDRFSGLILTLEFEAIEGFDDVEEIDPDDIRDRFIAARQAELALKAQSELLTAIKLAGETPHPDSNRDELAWHLATIQYSENH
jgi:hypothetical protein